MIGRAPAGSAGSPVIPNPRPARPDDYPRMQRLEAAHGLLTLPEPRWREVVLEHPLRDRLGPRWPIGWVLETDAGDLVGTLTNVPTRYVLNGAELIAATGRAWVVAPEYRGVALWLMAEYFNQPGVDLFINTTVNEQAVEAFRSFGSVPVPVGDWRTAAYWVTGYRGFAAAALRIKGIPGGPVAAAPLALALRSTDALRGRSGPPPGARHGTIDTRHTIDAPFDTFWEELQRRNPGTLLAARDRATLRWHFGSALRAGRAWVFVALRNGLMRAYCILKRQDHPPSGLVRMRLVDYQSIEPEHDLLPGLLRAAWERCHSQSIHVLEHLGMGLPRTRCLDETAPYRRQLAAWPYYFSAADPRLDATLRNPDLWDPSAFDGDSSL